MTVDNDGASAVVRNGPYTLPQEYLGGFWVIEASDLEAALEWASNRTLAHALVQLSCAR
ncbi:YciI family protein [Arthrobacter glacialis]|uniref:YCII-related domain-containing protein n=1 Tax=Arthrobacter glacialis TaxID=1664 RepID=A0A2S3ZVQ2_ARTGL|nr:YciI family protein [Arthrobacter glacialis]POH72957.1 hypothetical protein CVS27_12320 [Arthrobacter glacialis]